MDPRGVTTPPLGSRPSGNDQRSGRYEMQHGRSNSNSTYFDGNRSSTASIYELSDKTRSLSDPSYADDETLYHHPHRASVSSAALLPTRRVVTKKNRWVSSAFLKPNSIIQSLTHPPSRRRSPSEQGSQPPWYSSCSLLLRASKSHMPSPRRWTVSALNSFKNTARHSSSV